MIQTVCDICGEPLNTGDIIRLRVEDFHLPKWPKTEGERKRVRTARLEKMIEDLQQPNLTLSLDLHRGCFTEDVMPKLQYFYDR